MSALEQRCTANELKNEHWLNIHIRIDIVVAEQTSFDQPNITGEPTPGI